MTEDSESAGLINGQKFDEDIIKDDQNFLSLLKACEKLSETLDLKTVLQESVNNVTSLVGLDRACPRPYN